MHKWNNQKKLCGLQLTDTHARIIEIDSGGQQVRTKRRYTIELPADSILHGVILNETAVASSIEKMVISLGLEGDQVLVIIPSASMIVKKSFSRALEEDTIRELIQLDIQGPANKDILKHSMLNYIRLDASIKQEDVLVIATPIEVVESYMRVVKAGRLEPINIEPSLFSLYRGIFQQWKHGYVEIPQRFISLQTDLGFSEIIVMDQGVPVFTYTVNGSDYSTIEAYIYQLQMEFKRILHYFKQAVFSDPWDLRQLYLVGEGDWLKRLLQPLEMLFDGNLTVLSFAELWCANEMVYSADTDEFEELGA